MLVHTPDVEPITSVWWFVTCLSEVRMTRVTRLFGTKSVPQTESSRWIRGQFQNIEHNRNGTVTVINQSAEPQAHDPTANDT